MGFVSEQRAWHHSATVSEHVDFNGHDFGLDFIGRKQKQQRSPKVVLLKFSMTIQGDKARRIGQSNFMVLVGFGSARSLIDVG